MDKETILGTVQEIPVETRVKAWLFRIDKNFYHVAEYGGTYGMPYETSIWRSNSKGKRLSSEPIFTIKSVKDHMKCINEFIDSIETE